MEGYAKASVFHNSSIFLDTNVQGHIQDFVRGPIFLEVRGANKNFNNALKIYCILFYVFTNRTSILVEDGVKPGENHPQDAALQT